MDTKQLDDALARLFVDEGDGLSSGTIQRRNSLTS